MAKLSFIIVSPGKEFRITTLSHLLHASALTASILRRLLLTAALTLRNSVLLVGDLMMLLCLLLLSDLIAIVI